MVQGRLWKGRVEGEGGDGELIRRAKCGERMVMKNEVVVKREGLGCVEGILSE